MDKPTPPTIEEIRAMEQWLNDGTVPVSYIESVTGRGFSTAEPFMAAIAEL